MKRERTVSGTASRPRPRPRPRDLLDAVASSIPPDFRFPARQRGGERGAKGLDWSWSAWMLCVCAAVPEARAQRVRLVEIGLGRWECAGAREGRCAPSAVRRAVGGDSLLGAASRARTGDRALQDHIDPTFTWGLLFDWKNQAPIGA